MRTRLQVNKRKVVVAVVALVVILLGLDAATEGMAIDAVCGLWGCE